jgi:hypothetical protein
MLTGGEQIQFRDEAEFDQALMRVAGDVHHRYALTFQPESRDVGFHTLQVRLVNQQKGMTVTYRTGYWFDVKPDAKSLNPVHNQP